MSAEANNIGLLPVNVGSIDIASRAWAKGGCDRNSDVTMSKLTAEHVVQCLRTMKPDIVKADFPHAVSGLLKSALREIGHHLP